MQTKAQQQTKITNLSHDGRGICTIEGKVTFIDNALTGETVVFNYKKKHGKYAEGIATEILETSPDRVVPQCEHFGICGGCSLQHLSSQAQIALKQQTLLEQLKHFGRIEPINILPAITGPAWHYRHKARIGAKYVNKKNTVLVGFREKNSHFIADLKRCIVLAKPVDDMIVPLKVLIESLTIKEHIPQIEVAVTQTATSLIIRHMRPLADEDITKLQTFAKQFTIHLYLQPGGLDTIHLLWPDEQPEQSYYSLAEHDLKLFFQPNNFSQVNPFINNKMIDLALELLSLKASDKVLDLFCGVGNFTLPIARYAGQVVGIEGNMPMVDQACANAHYNQIKNVRFFAGDLAKPDTFGSWSQESYNKILLDPPRTGALALLPFIGKQRPEKIVYVSCNPATLARDAGTLVHDYGYRLISAGVLDMFPHTSHVESIALFHK